MRSTEKADEALLFSTIDHPMLINLRRACREDAKPRANEVLESIWEELRTKICEEYDLCSKLHKSDVVLDVLQIAVIGVPDAMHKIIAASIILGFRRGPKWMCGCGRSAHG
jgi:hypothetical protein